MSTARTVIPAPHWLTVKEAAQRLRVSDRTLYRWLYANKIKAYKFGGVWRIKAEEFDAGGKI